MEQQKSSKVHRSSKCFSIALKDLKIVLNEPGSLLRIILFGIITIFILSLAHSSGEELPPLTFSSIFWLASSFAAVLLFSQLYSHEEIGGAKIGLLMAPISVWNIWLAKTLAGLSLLLFCQILFLLVEGIFFNLLPGINLAIFAQIFFVVLIVDWGIAVLASFLGALASGSAGKDALFTILLFPLLLPAIFAGIRLLEKVVFEQSLFNNSDWIFIVLAFDSLFTGIGLILFPLVYGK